MANPILYPLIAIQAVLIALALSSAITPFFILPVAALIYLVANGGVKGPKESEVLVFVKDLLREYRSGLRTAIESTIRRGGRVAEEVRLFVSRFELGEYSSEFVSNGEHGRTGELLGILAYGLSTGRNVRKGLENLALRIENEMRTSNRIRSKAGSLHSVTFMGMAFFLPLFGGISSTIISTSLGLLGESATTLKHGFICSVALYILVVLVIGSLFRKPDSRFMDLASSILPIFSFSTFMLLASSTYITYAI